MNTKLITSLTAAVASAVAFSTFAASAQAASFGNSGLSFDQDTLVNFTFLSSQGAYQSTLNIFQIGANNVTTSVATLFREVRGSDNGSASDYRGTFGNAVTSPTGSNPIAFLFKANTNYTLGLDSGRNGIVFSTNNLNSGNSQQARFTGNVFGGSSEVRFDDRGAGNDKDFNDFVLKAEAVPEPLTMGGIALAGAGLAYARRRRQAV